MITSRTQLYELLSSVFPTRENGYSGAKGMPVMPYINFFFSGSDNSPADNKAYIKAEDYRIELYSPIQTAAEDRAALEAALDVYELFYIKTNESPLKQFGAVMSSYEISIYIKESEE
jgi:hypothetical protein